MYPALTLVRAAAVTAAGMGAGFINSIAGSGTLISFPTLTALGWADKAANIANSIGLFPGQVSSVHGFRRELHGQRARLTFLGSASAVGAALGAGLLLRFPGSFKAIVPWLILLAVGLLIVQPRLQRQVAARLKNTAGRAEHRSPLLWFGVFATGIYGGFFGAGQGIILIAILGVFLVDDLKRINAAKNLLSGVVGLASGIVFVARGAVDWRAVACIAVGSIVGAQLGALVGRRIPAAALRAFIIVVGTTVAIQKLRR
jgi:uncharacterized protein